MKIFLLLAISLSFVALSACSQPTTPAVSSEAVSDTLSSSYTQSSDIEGNSGASSEISTSADENASIASTEPNTIGRSDFSLIRESDGATLSLGMTRAEAEKIVGEPTGTELGFDNYKNGISIVFRTYGLIQQESDGKAVAYRDPDSELEQKDQTAVYIRYEPDDSVETVFNTIRKVQIGSDKDSVLSVYGEKNSISGRANSSYYFNSQANSACVNEAEIQSLSEYYVWGIDFAFDKETSAIRAISIFDQYAVKTMS